MGNLPSAGLILQRNDRPVNADRAVTQKTFAILPRRHYSVPIYYLGNFCAAAGFCPVFGGTLRDSLFAGLLGLIIGFVSRQMDRRETSPFFSTIVEAFAMAVPAYLAAGFHLVDYIDFVIIGTLMILVPGLLITTSMRDIIYGDESDLSPHGDGEPHPLGGPCAGGF